MTRPSHRSDLLAAAEKVLVHGGAAGLTLDAVADVAGMSKGGLLYHFPTKTALIAALITEMLDGFDRAVAGLRAADPELRGSFARAYVRATAMTSVREAGLPAIFELASREPAVLETWRERVETWAESIRGDGLPPERAEAVRLAADGLWLALVAELPLAVAPAVLVAQLEELTR
jgi:AcrR family transcriptional regulator